MATYKPDQYAKKLVNNIDKLLISKKLFQEAIYALVLKVDDRVFDNGKDKTGGTIGTYSTKPLYVNPSSPMNRKGFPTKGKSPSSKSVFLNGKTRRTRYFPNYSSYKTAQGINTLGGRVNLQITKHFRRAFLTKAFPMISKKSGVLFSLGVRPSQANPVGKLTGIMVDKYPLAFKFNKTERAFILAELREIFINAMKK